MSSASTESMTWETARTFVHLAADSIKGWRHQADSGCQLLATTLTPFSLSTDGWSTEAGQATKASNAP